MFKLRMRWAIDTQQKYRSTKAKLHLLFCCVKGFWISWGDNTIMTIKITDNSAEFIAAMKTAALAALEECGLTAEGFAKLLCPVDTGNLRNSITHQVNSGEPAVYIGSNSEYAAYVELGTGKYVPGGRPTPWVYQDAHGNWHLTHGQRAQPYLKPAVADHLSTYKSIIEGELKNG